MGNLLDELEEFDRHRESHGTSGATRKHQRDSLRRLAAHAGNPPVDAVTAEMVDGFFRARLTAGIGHGTLNVDLVGFRAFFEWACRTHRTGVNPVEGRKNFKVGKQRKLFIPDDQFPHLLDVAENRTDPETGRVLGSIRDRAIIATALRTFMRVTDLANLRVRDLGLGPRPSLTFYVEKRDETRTLPVNPGLERELRRWLTAYAEDCGGLAPDWFLFPGERPWRSIAGRWVPPAGARWNPGRPVSKLGERERAIILAAGFQPGVRPSGKSEGVGGHVLRRSGANAWLNQLAEAYGTDDALLTVSFVLGHAQVPTTMQYLDADHRARRAAELMSRPMFATDTATVRRLGVSA